MSCVEYLFVAMISFGNMLFVDASDGDRHTDYQNCIHGCSNANCSNELDLSRFYDRQGAFERLLRWSCQDECKYECMWSTVQHFKEKGYAVPQFYGKWPFRRCLGIQEPASTLFSLLNLASCWRMLYVFLTRIPHGIAMHFEWCCYCSVGIAAWSFSTVFHARDVTVTELCDYAGAFACILTSFYCCLVRLLSPHGERDPFNKLIFLFLFGLYLQHVYYLGWIKFDYGYNMKLNVSIGVATSLLWLLWCLKKFSDDRKQFQYVIYCAVFIIIANCLLLLELFDFPPIWWTFDAHALWHLGTVPLPTLWTKFVINDCNVLLHRKYE